MVRALAALALLSTPLALTPVHASAATPNTLDINVVASSDDAEESAAGKVSTSSSDLELVLDGTLQTVGVRFTGLAVPPGSAVTAAWIQFETDEKKSGASSLTIYGQAVDLPATFASSRSGDISSRARTSAFATWAPPAWTILQERGPNQRTPDLSGVLREIVSRPGWASGNPVAFIITGTGVRTAEAFDGTRAPSLHVEYVPPSTPNTAPVVSAGVDQAVLRSAGAVLQASVSDDGLPVPPGFPTLMWTTVTGPGSATFADIGAASTTAAFPVEGTYTLRATATDGVLSASDDVVVSAEGMGADGWLIRAADSGASVWTGSAQDDPIVFPGQPGAAHLHDFFCNEATNAFSTYESMVAAASACPSGDTAGYWAPALYSNGVKVDPFGGLSRQALYYRDNNVLASTRITPFPPDFKMVIGDSHATTLAEANAAGAKIGSEQYWGCSDNSEVGKPTAPVDCATGIISLHIGFPSCWNGVKVPGDQIAAGTLKWPSSGTCPAGYPNVLPRLIERFEYPVGTSSQGITLSSGGIYSVHADFWNTWQQTSLEALVTHCLDGVKVDCGTNPTLGVNQPPAANAGPDQTVVRPGAATLAGTAMDDGLPSGTLTSSWSVISGPGVVTFADQTSAATTASFSLDGSYVLRLNVSDGAMTATDDVAVSVTSAGTPVVLEVPVIRSSDDAEENASTGSVSLSSSDLELVTDSAVQVVGTRFAGLQIPAGSRITAAWVQFETDELKSAATVLNVQAQASDDAAPFTSTAFGISSRLRTIATVPWSPPAWSILQERGAGQRTPDLTGVLQEIVSRPGWAAGHAIAIVITGSGVRTAEAFDGTAAPLLHVEFLPPGA